MGRHRVLTGADNLVNAGNFTSFSWGPFTGPIRIKAAYVDLGTTTQQNQVAGFFVASGPDAPTGAVANPAPVPPGWQPLGDHHQAGGQSFPANEGHLFPYATQSTVDRLTFSTFLVDLNGFQYFLKCWINNRTAASADPKVVVVIEENPDGAQGFPIDVRPQPGDAPTPPAPPAPAPLPPAPSTPATPPPAAPGPPALPPPLPGAFPPIVIDPHDPLTSALEPV